MHTMEHYSATKSNETGSGAVMWRDPEAVKQREGSQKEKNKHHVLMHGLI